MVSLKTEMSATASAAATSFKMAQNVSAIYGLGPGDW